MRKYIEKESPDGASRAISQRAKKCSALKSWTVTGQIDDLLLSYTISQFYKNDTRDAIELIYTFPSAYDAAILGMEVFIEGESSRGSVFLINEAKTICRSALNNGDSAARLRLTAPGLFILEFGSLKPGQSATVNTRCIKLLKYVRGLIRAAIPVVVDTNRVSRAIHSRYYDTPFADPSVRYDFFAKILLKGAFARGRVVSPSHDIRLEEQDGELVAKLASPAYLDRDFVLVSRGEEDMNRAECAADYGSASNYDYWMGFSTLLPRLERTAPRPVSVKILPDCSYSMAGAAFEQARRTLIEFMRRLDGDDYVIS